LAFDADAEFETAWKASRHRSVVTEYRPKVNPATGNVLHDMGLRPINEVYSNRKSLERRMCDLRAAQKVCREELLIAADVSVATVTAKIEALRQGISAGTELVRIGDTMPSKDPRSITIKPTAKDSIYDRRGLTVLETPRQPVGEVN
jgi:hypothetical protein